MNSLERIVEVGVCESADGLWGRVCAYTLAPEALHLAAPVFKIDQPRPSPLAWDWSGHMYALTEQPHELHDRWRDTFRQLMEAWQDPAVPWEEVRPIVYDAMREDPNGPPDQQRERFFVWLDGLTDDERRLLVDDSAREQLFRRLLEESDPDLFDFFPFLYQPREGDRYSNETTTSVFEAGVWRDAETPGDASAQGEAGEAIAALEWSADSDEAARLGIPYWDGQHYQIFRDGEWHELGEAGEASAAPEWSADSDEAARLGIPFWDGKQYQVFRDGEWHELDATAPHGTVADMTWVTPEQEAQLAELDLVRGDWREWLPAELDQRWPEWRMADADLLPSGLDNVLPSLLMVQEEAIQDIVDSVVSESVARLYARAGELASELDMSEEEFLEELDDMSPEELTQEILAAAFSA